MKNVGEKEKKPFYKQVWFWVMIVVFGLIGSFGSDDKPKETTTDNNTIIETEANHNYLLDIPPTVKDVMNGFGDTVIGQCAYIYITSDQLKELTSDQLKEFADSVVDGSGYNWVSIMTYSGTGICFPGSDINYAVYGELGENGILEKSQYTLFRDADGNYNYYEDEVQDDSLSVFDFFSGKESGQVDTGNLQLLHGQLLSVICNDGIVVVNAKIEPNLTNKMTIQQNYFNVGDLIKNHGFNTCKELQYWAVADMTNGEEEKVISFDLSKEVIEKIYDEQIYDNQIEDYVDNLYIHASLQ